MTLSSEYQRDELEIFWRMWQKVTTNTAMPWQPHPEAYNFLLPGSRGSLRP